MMNSVRVQRAVGVLAVTAMVFALLGVVSGRGDAWAKRAKPAKDAAGAAADQTGDQGKKEAARPARGSVPAGVTLNACGCYHTGNSCVCTNRNARCDCPEDCEPVGCEEKRQKDLDREIAAEVKHAQDDEKKREEAEAARERKINDAERAQREDENEDTDSSSEAAAEGMPDPLQKSAEKAPEKTNDKSADKTKAAGTQKAAFKPGAKATKTPRKERASTKK